MNIHNNVFFVNICLCVNAYTEMKKPISPYKTIPMNSKECGNVDPRISDNDNT